MLTEDFCDSLHELPNATSHSLNLHSLTRHNTSVNAPTVSGIIFIVPTIKFFLREQLWCCNLKVASFQCIQKSFEQHCICYSGSLNCFRCKTRAHSSYPRFKYHHVSIKRIVEWMKNNPIPFKFLTPSTVPRLFSNYCPPIMYGNALERMYNALPMVNNWLASPRLCRRRFGPNSLLDFWLLIECRTSMHSCWFLDLISIVYLRVGP